MSSRVLLGVLALVLLFVALWLGAAIGETAIPLDVVAKTIANRVWNAGYPIAPIDEGIVWSYRLSRAVVAACCGAALALSGVVLQSLLRNSLADPYILGISAGASTGAVSVAILGIGAGVLSLSVGAFIGAIVAFVLVSLLALRAGRGNSAIILAGIAGSQLFNALTSLIVTKAANAEQARGIMFWLLGNLSGVRWPDVALALPACVVGLLICLWHARALDAFTFGSESAASLGIPVRRVYAVLIGVSAMMTAVMVSIVGSIGFIGLVIPHAARMLVGVRHGRLLPAAALIGAIFMILADIVSRIIIPGQVLPIGVITALVGAPAFALLLGQRRAQS
ncbi:iron ABC transporter permease [Brucella pituitosa]|uniref:Iron ABC transporter permease n=2 Tax=Brucella pituitosa TaxID=571256 RepID=A0A643EYY3_9HYPH|nr:MULTISPECIES: iron ABC transporter permease [Brucella]PQZ50247.1 iron ABC transporter permease [Ochrobactrum sp. MYb19]PRA55213.1 iron ABC transporter permease [Ochrobactrum sp. MYb68]PRA68289.1 iron ABC transporter permease [Ochrobactrum sp. MYb18]PRA74484.1 iron ABC transporter permease [Brucella thiophenivorans]PRA86585.1 iron ABC transporter permease [Ochrobactrum sp. MYb29]PRA90539.1 iron ABC transporter permease [Ochrobactrum sp. MYb14]PRA95990.1 iron ABC transporter permease [Ochro